MNGRKTPAVAYISRLIKTTGKTKLKEILEESPLKTNDIQLILDFTNGYTYKELATKYNKSVQRINQWKRTAYEKLHYFLVKKL